MEWIVTIIAIIALIILTIALIKIEDDPENAAPTIFLISLIGTILFIMIVWDLQTYYDNGYKQGQVDAIKQGKVKYRLETKVDTVWVDIEEPKIDTVWNK